MEEWIRTCLCKGHSGEVPLAAPKGGTGEGAVPGSHVRTLSAFTPSPSTTQLSLLLRKGSWHKPPPSGAFSDPSSISRMKIHVEQAILNFFLAEKNYHVLDISAVVGTRSPGPKVTHRAGSPWQHIQ